MPLSSTECQSHWTLVTSMIFAIFYLVPDHNVRFYNNSFYVSSSWDLPFVKDGNSPTGGYWMWFWFLYFSFTTILYTYLTLSSVGIYRFYGRLCTDHLQRGSGMLSSDGQHSQLLHGKTNTGHFLMCRPFFCSFLLGGLGLVLI